uniref:Uncharacterized protein n=1 Tax=Timema bartmani TaxID=61472 RepID=A0A7R9F1U5_9NEOP|nr:unnamed protein product [Timema bartmani]
MEKRYKKMKRRQNKIKKACAKRLRQRWLERFACSLADTAEMVGSKVKKHRSNAKTRFIARAIQRLRQRWLERFACSLADTAEMVGSKVKKHRSNAKTRFIARAIQAKVGLVNASEETPDYAIPPILKLRKNLFLTFASWTYLMFEEMKKLKEKGKLRSVVEIFDETYDSNKKKKKHKSRRRMKDEGNLGDSSEDSDNRESLNKTYENWDSPYNMPARAKKNVLGQLANEPFWDLSQKRENHHFCNVSVYEWVDYYKVTDMNRTYPEPELFYEKHEYISGSFCSSHSHDGFNPKFRKIVDLEEVP